MAAGEPLESRCRAVKEPLEEPLEEGVRRREPGALPAPSCNGCSNGSIDSLLRNCRPLDAWRTLAPAAAPPAAFLSTLPVVVQAAKAKLARPKDIVLRACFMVSLSKA